MPRLLFVTGKLAGQALQDTLGGMSPEFEYEIAILPISVAALMDAAFICRHLHSADSFDRLILPGLCKGDLSKITDKLHIETVLGPKNVKDIPAFFGKTQQLDEYGQYRAQIIAEIVDAGELSIGAILERAEYFRKNGADIIDIGCSVEGELQRLDEIVAVLKQQGYMVAVDSFNPADILKADQAGADFILSLNSVNLQCARSLRAKPVLVPDSAGDLASLEENMAQLDDWNISYIVDPVLNPIGVGFTESLEKFIKMRRNHPNAEMLMGAGNITELTDADSIGINAVLAGIVEELQINYILTTEVISWARGSVREMDIARRLMHYACNHKMAPKQIDTALIALKDPGFESLDENELRAIQANVRDRHFRIFIDGAFVYVFNNSIFIKENSLDSILKQLPLQDASEAFYLGKELQKAFLALQLGKSYIQDQDLLWGYLTK